MWAGSVVEVNEADLMKLVEMEFAAAVIAAEMQM